MDFGSVWDIKCIPINCCLPPIIREQTETSFDLLGRAKCTLRTRDKYVGCWQLMVARQRQLPIFHGRAWYGERGGGGRQQEQEHKPWKSKDGNWTKLKANVGFKPELKKRLKSNADRDRKGAYLSRNLSGHRVALGHRLWVTHLLWNLPAIDAHYQHQHQQEHH